MRWVIAVVLLGAAVAVAQRATQGRRWEMYEGEMQNPAEDPPDAWREGEFAWGRLRFRSPQDGRRRFGHLRWGTDTNKGDRTFIVGLRRLTRIDARSVEQIVDVDSDEMYDYPWLYAVGVGDWMFSESQAKRLRNFFERGGFLMVDDFHNEYEWESFMAGIEQILPGHQSIELPNDHSIFQTVFDLRERYHIPGLNVLRRSPWERGGYGEHWRAIVDDQDRVVVAACFNMDLGDAWEWADLPEYPEKYSALAIRIGVNYVTYAMTH